MSYIEDFKNMVPNLITYTGIFLLLWLFPGGLGFFLLAILIPFIIKDIILSKSFNVIFSKKYFIGLLKTAAISTGLYFFIKWLGGYGLLGVIIIVLTVSGYKLWSGRTYLMSKIREIEIMIWGRTNDKRK